MNKEVKTYREFIKKYGNNYEPRIHDMLVDYCKGESFRSVIEIQQMKYALGDLEPNVYEEVVDELYSQFNISCRILDIASGCYPAFAYEIAKRQQEIGAGTITCIEPKLVCNEPLYPNVNFIKDYFHNNFDLSQYDLITSFLPCYATKEVVKAAIMQQKSFFVLPCSCHFIPKSEEGYEYITINNMFDYAYYLAHRYSEQCSLEKSSMGIVKTNNLSQKVYLYKK